MVRAEDLDIYGAARDTAVVIMTKDGDFPEMLQRLGSPPQVLWITCGNTPNARLRDILQTSLPTALELLEQGETRVEISSVGILWPR